MAVSRRDCHYNGAVNHGDFDWLTRESSRWVDDGVITPDQRDTILQRYPGDIRDPLFSGSLLTWLAWLVAGSGIILLVAWNWESLSHAARVGGTCALTLVAYLAAVREWRGGRVARAGMVAFVGSLLAGASVAAMTDMWQVDAGQTWPMLVWAVVIAVTAAVTASPVTTALGGGVLAWWVLIDAGRPPASWAFLLVFPLLAWAAERRSHWLSSGTLSVAFGGWVVLTAMEVWEGSSAVAAVFALTVGAALDAWAHAPAGRGPAFARPTPALVFTMSGFALLTAGALSRSAPGAWLSEPASQAPALVLLASLAGVALWQSGTRGWTRARLVASVVMTWMVLWIAVAPVEPVPAWWSWMWLVVASAGLVGLTVSCADEAMRTGNRGVLLAAIGSILLLIVVHITAGPNRFGRSSVVLLVAAAVLWWVTSRHKPMRSSPEP